MAIICWGNLAKSADDTQRIEQSIQAYVEDHDENVNAHQVYGSSLYMHRVNEILDHLDGSLRMQHFPLDQIIGIGSFESFDGWNTYGLANPGMLGALLRPTTAGINDYAYLYPKGYAGANFTFDPMKNPIFQTTVLIGNNTNQLIYIVAGDAVIDNPFTAVGFKISSGTMYAFWMKDSVEHTSEITGVTMIGVHCFRIKVDSSVPSIEFYVDGELKYTATTDIPVDAPNILCSYYIKNLSDALRTIWPIDWFFQQDRQFKNEK